MKIEIAVSGLVLFVTGTINTFSQTILRPNFALKSHETLEISKIETTSEATVLYMSIENRISGGAFCADKNIFLISPVEGRISIKEVKGIPLCPENYKFSRIGEKLEFTLVFPPLNHGTEWIDLVEDCSSNCFSFYGITLNSDLNKKLDEAFSLTEKGETAKAISLYISILENLNNKKSGIEGSLFTYIITLATESGDKAGAEEWYKKMLSSMAPRLELYIINLNSRGIKY
jgi:hypothetical protein